jgi:hypothetical protein
MASIKTNLRASQYDSLRESCGITGNLTLYRATATGYTLLTTVTAGWFSQRERDQIEGTQFLAVRIAETDANLAQMISTVVKGVAAVGIMSLRYKTKAKVDPMEDPRLWLFQCDPTGEAI